MDHPNWKLMCGPNSLCQTRSRGLKVCTIICFMDVDFGGKDCESPGLLSSRAC